MNIWVYTRIYASTLRVYIRVTFLPKVSNHSNPIKTALVTTFNVTCNCKLMRAVKEENSPN